MPWREAMLPAACGAAAGASAATVAGLWALQRYFSRELKKPLLLHTPSSQHDDLEDRHLLEEVKLLLRDYWPHPLLEFSGYTSTIWSGLWAGLPARVVGELEELPLSDGGTVSLHWGEPPLNQSQVRIALMFPGLNNDSKTSFVQDSMRHFQSEGFQAVALNYRGIGGTTLTSARIGCSDSWQDFNEVIDYVLSRHPGAMLFGVGFSMGAGMLLRYLGEEGTKCRLRAGVAIAAPVDFVAVSRYLESSLKKRLINFIMASGAKIAMTHSLFTSPFAAVLDKKAVLAARSLRQIEEATICKLHGYRDANEYYEKNSPLPVLRQIAVPTLIVNAEDDPVVGISAFPREEVQKNSRLYAVITKRGGHLGWGSGGLGAAAWTDDMAVDFLQACTLRSQRAPSMLRSRM